MKPKRTAAKEYYKPYAHDESEDNISTWNKQPTVSKKQEWSFKSLFPFYGYLKGEKIGGSTYLITSFLVVFGFGLYLVNRFCLGKLKNRQVL